MLNNISEKGLSKTHKVRVINFPVINFPRGTSDKITNQLDDLIKGKLRKPLGKFLKTLHLHN